MVRLVLMDATAALQSLVATSPLSNATYVNTQVVLFEEELIAPVEERACDVLALSGVALDHLVVWLEACKGHLSDGVLLVRSLLSRDDRRVGG
jgi:hypothetical protein